jgi:hypothetical protein
VCSKESKLFFLRAINRNEEVGYSKSNEMAQMQEEMKKQVISSKADGVKCGYN